MRMLVLGAVLLLLAAACDDTNPWHAEVATAIGEQLAGRLAEPLAQAADTQRDADFDRVKDALDEAIDDIALPAGVYRILLGSHSGSTSEPGYADVSLPLVVVPIEKEDMFCMVFALSSTGDLVAEPASGDPLNRCGDTEKARLAEP